MLALADYAKWLRGAAGLDEPLLDLVRTWDRAGLVRRVWERDSSLWTGADEHRWLGWLSVNTLADPVDKLMGLARDVRHLGLTNVVLLGIGGSSLGAEALSQVLRGRDDSPALHVIDTTDPAQISRMGSRIDLDRTLFIVSSKSGTTLESTLLADYFLELVRSRLGPREAGTRFLAITDPGSALEQLARAQGFSQVWHGQPSVGGRFSVLSNFGLVPAAACGVDVSSLLGRAAVMVASCGWEVSAGLNPGVQLGLTLGLAASQGRDKVTLVLSPAIAALGPWLEQLLAESTGKRGRGLIPVVDEEVGEPSAYGHDRLFVYLRLEAGVDPVQDEALRRLADVGCPVITLGMSDPLDVGAEFFRWQFATAVCGAVLEVNPFDQPDVEASKVATRALMTTYAPAVGLRTDRPLALLGEIALFADLVNTRFLRSASGGQAGVEDLLSAHLARLGGGDYFAVLAYIDRSPTHFALLQQLRQMVRDTCRVATAVGFGPRYLHSTGQLFKGGPATGLFLQITCDDGVDLELPSRGYSFGTVKAAQALADGRVLAERNRRLLTVHLGSDVVGGLTRLKHLVRGALR